jgi:alkanesulfonate monooxygenase SsuD/methylene tetrahydromethanopterin reductase-like flavin-dependent oxidoreductase (luciferase family)
MKFGIIPLMQKGFTTNPAWARPFLQMIEAAGVESVWTVEHPIVAENYEPLYSYSADGQAPFRPDTEMCDPLEWLGFAAGVTEKLRLGTGVVLLPLHAPIILAKRVATLDAV